MSENQIFVQKKNTNENSTKRKARLVRIINDFVVYNNEAMNEVKNHPLPISVVLLKKKMIDHIGKSFNRNHYYFNAFLYNLKLGTFPQFEIDLDTGLISYGKNKRRIG